MDYSSHILVVEDESNLAEFMQEVLVKAGYIVTLAATVQEAMVHLRGSSIHILITDMHLPDGNGLDLLGQVLPTHRPLQGLLMTGRATLESVLDAAKLGVCDFITKPFNRETLLRVVQTAVAARSAICET